MVSPQRVMEVLADVVERPAADRRVYLAAFCAGDEALEREVLTLLCAHERAKELYPEPAPLEQPGQRIGRFKLLQRIGEGGFGTVWMAEQEEPVRRMVALKILKAGMDTAQVVARFEAERQALALMDHPNIAHVFDGGTTPQGRPYFAMELVRGVPITKYCDEASLSPRERLELFVPVCQAVQHAHFKGVIHRDIKPSNVLVTLHDGRPVPKVIDFGIAKAIQGRLTERTLFTEFQQMLGTPEYMSPEQAELSGLDVDTRADVYSLGVLLYELLTGTRPFDFKELLQSGLAEMLRTIKEVEPPKPSTRVSTLGDAAREIARSRRMHPRALGPLMRGELDWIVMKTLEKERHRRYSSAEALAEDVQRHLRNEPVLAGPPSRVYKLRKYVQRHLVGVAASAAIALSLAAGAAAAGWGWLRASDEAERANAQALAAQRSAQRAGRLNTLLEQLVASADPHSIKGPNYTVRQLLADYERELGGQLSDEPEVEASLRATLAGSYLGLGMPEAAQRHVERSKSLRLALYGPNSAEHADSLVLEAATLHAQGDWEAAFARIGETVELLRGLGPERRVKLAESLLIAGDCELHLGRLDDAGRTFEEVLGLAAELGDESSAVQTLERRAELRRMQGQLSEAEADLRDVLARRAALQADDPMAAAGTHAALSLVLQARGELDEALTEAQASVSAARAAAGDSHPSLAHHLIVLAGALMSRGELGRAIEMHREAVDVYRSAFGDSHASLAEALSSLARAETLGRRMEDAVRHAEQALAIDENLGADLSYALARDHLVLGGALLHSRRLAEAEEHDRAALEMRQELLGDDHPQTAQARHDLACVLHSRGRYSEAETLLSEALTSLDAAGPDHAVLASDVRHVLAVVVFELGRPEEAAAHAEAALEARRRIFGDGSSRVADTALLLSSIQRALGRAPSESRSDVDASALEDSPAAVARLCELARRQSDQGRLDEAEKSLRDALDMQLRLRLDGGVDVANTRTQLGLLLCGAGRFEEALDQLESALATYRANLGAPHPWIATAIGNLGLVSIRRGDPDAAERYYGEALAMYEALPGDQGLAISGCRNGLGEAMRLSGRPAQAVEQHRQALELRRTKLGAASPAVAASSRSLGVALLDLDQPGEAAEHLREALTILDRLGAPRAGTWPVAVDLGTALERSDRAAEAEPLYQAYVDAARTPDADPLQLASTLAQLGQCRLNQGRAADAEPALRECLGIRTQRIPEDWLRHNAASLLGAALLAQGKSAEAEPLLVEAAEKIRPPAPVAHRRREALERVVALYEATGRPDEAARWRAQLAESGAGR